MPVPIPGTRIADLETPSVLIDLDRVEANLRRAAATAEASGVTLRPHTKTHKSPYFARRQMVHGASGITVAKVGEAEVMATAGLTDIFIANTIYGAEKARRIRTLAERITLSVGVDHIDQARLLSEAMTGAAVPLSIMVEVDTGSRRGGVAPAAVVPLAQLVAAMPGLAVRGVYTYEGYTASALNLDALIDVQRVAQALMVQTGQAVGQALGITPVISIGSTPGLLSGAGYLPGITEIRPGTYIFLDASQAVLAGGVEHCAATVLATVVSRPAATRAILDTGSKALTSDTRPAGIGKTSGHGQLMDLGLTVARLSEEHGVIDEGAAQLQVGQKVRVLPNHICPVINLFNEVIGVRNGVVEVVLPVEARGRLQ